MNLLFWIYWDPARDIITLPIIQRPVTWYGLLFALGFIAGYYIFLEFYKKYLALRPFFTSLSEISLYSLKRFFQEHETYAGLFFQAMSLREKNYILNYRGHEKVPKDLEKKILAGLNRMLAEGGGEKSLLQHKILDYSRRHLSSLEQQCLCHRLHLEESFPKIFLPLAKRAAAFGEKISLYFLMGTVLGARLGHILFYEKLQPFLAEPLRILKTWEGGLSSHGAAIGILIALGFFLLRHRKNFSISFLTILDMAVIPVSLAGAFIRIGNFINQEILGTFTECPWGIIFGHPADGGLPIPRHPAQLYESVSYFAVFFLLWVIYRNKDFRRLQGKIFGLFLILVFSLRFGIEFLKEEQSMLLSQGAFLVMGQYLSIPLIVLGLILWFRKEKSGYHLDKEAV
ncbi:MAG: hypothetical protein Tsb0015_12020 [Simkaniaceae bacterium]